MSKAVGFEATSDTVSRTEKELASVHEADYVVIGSGIGGLSAAALLSYYGYSVIVLESHYLPVRALILLKATVIINCPS
jgi:ribulose 1,5-bisphosphate synthetase/thiazole synthase